MPVQISDNDKRILDRAIDSLATAVSSLKIELGSYKCWHKEKHPYCMHLDTNIKIRTKIDEAIAEVVKALRLSMRQEFFDKLAFRALERIDTINNRDYNLAVATTRIWDAIPYVIALSKKWQGKPYNSTINDIEARKILKERGLL